MDLKIAPKKEKGITICNTFYIIPCVNVVKNYLRLTFTAGPFCAISTLFSLANQPKPKSAKFPFKSNSFFILAKEVVPFWCK